MNVSVVCPFYNEEAIIENAVAGMVAALQSLPHNWELILVNDGSTDRGPELAKAAARGNERVRVVGYDSNRGRGHALRTGIAAARGDIVVTTEIDLSWGEDIVHRLVAAFEAHPDADMIVASPNLPGGGYRHVPAKRVFLSKVGNMILRASQQGDMTMYTGMTRAYRRKAFLGLPLDENEKEFHLEVAQKAQAYGFKIYEIPCVLEWKDHRLAQPGSAKRKSSSKTSKLMRTHMAFAAAAAPYRYILPISCLIALFAAGFMALAVIDFLRGNPSAFYLNTGLALLMIAIVIFSVGMLSYQGLLIQRDVWRLRRDLRQSRSENKNNPTPEDL